MQVSSSASMPSDFLIGSTRDSLAVFRRAVFLTVTGFALVEICSFLVFQEYRASGGPGDLLSGSDIPVAAWKEWVIAVPHVALLALLGFNLHGGWQWLPQSLVAVCTMALFQAGARLFGSDWLGGPVTTEALLASLWNVATFTGLVFILRRMLGNAAAGVVRPRALPVRLEWAALCGALSFGVGLVAWRLLYAHISEFGYFTALGVALGFVGYYGELSPQTTRNGA